MFLSERREFPSAPCFTGKKKLNDSSRLDVVEIARVPDMLPSLFLPGRAKDLSAPQGAEGNSRLSDRNISLFPVWSG
jgi:hypothetical protein